jgi:hypothetical protein
VGVFQAKIEVATEGWKSFSLGQLDSRGRNLCPEDYDIAVLAVLKCEAFERSHSFSKAMNATGISSSGFAYFFSSVCLIPF